MTKIYLDACVWCRPFDEPTDRIAKEAEAFFKIMENVEQKKYAVVNSIVLEDEIDEIEDIEKRTLVRELILTFATESIYEISESKKKEIERSAGLKSEDAFHLACALEAGCEYFISADDKILSKSKDVERLYKIKIIDPVKFAEEK